LRLIFKPRDIIPRVPISPNYPFKPLFLRIYKKGSIYMTSSRGYTDSNRF